MGKNQPRHPSAALERKKLRTESAEQAGEPVSGVEWEQLGPLVGALQWRDKIYRFDKEITIVPMDHVILIGLEIKAQVE